MSLQFSREKIADCVHFSVVRDAKFKSNLLSVNLIVPLSDKTAADYALVPFVLRKGGRACPDFTMLNRRLEGLYGAHLYADVRRVGEAQVMNMAISTVDNAYTLHGENVNREVAELLLSLLTEPNVCDGAFAADDVALEKGQLIDLIESEINEKRSYAVKQLERHMFVGEPFSVNRYGDVASVQKITPQSLYESYKTLLYKCQVEILFTGGGDPSEIKALFASTFSGINRCATPYPGTSILPQAGDVKRAEEQLDVNQAKLCLGFRTKLTPDTMAAFRLMSALYGSTPVSKLFVNVREKMSLCYYCLARFDKNKGVMIVDAGIEQEKRAIAEEEILRQLELVRQGAFTDEEVENTRLALNNSLKTLVDSPSMLESYFLSQIIGNQIVLPQEEVKQLYSVSREQIIEAARATRLDTVYFLTGKRESE